jgi:FkbM family methyltransferase
MLTIPKVLTISTEWRDMLTSIANWQQILTALMRKQATIKIVFKNGVQIEADREMFWLMKNIFFRHVYTPAPLSIGEHDVIVDIGAHIGVFTVFAASITHKTVYAFEPSPNNFASLEQNVQASHLTNVIAQHCAVSDTIGSTQLLLHHNTSLGNTLSGHFSPEKLESYKNLDGTLPFDPPVVGSMHHAQLVQVPTTTLQEIMDRYHIEQIDFLKMDCEGSEGPILHSLPPNYLRRVRQIAMEFHDHLSSLHHEDIQLLLEQAGFLVKLQWDQHSAFGYLYAWKR